MSAELKHLPKQRMMEDRALRDAAKAVVREDLAHLRGALRSRGIGERIADRVTDGFTDLFEEGLEVADNNRGIVATVIAAFVLWFARHPLAALFGNDGEDDDDWSDDA